MRSYKSLIRTVPLYYVPFAAYYPHLQVHSLKISIEVARVQARSVTATKKLALNPQLVWQAVCALQASSGLAITTGNATFSGNMNGPCQRRSVDMTLGCVHAHLVAKLGVGAGPALTWPGAILPPGSFDSSLG